MLTKQKAFTLIEVMAALAVFAISATGLYSINQQSVLIADRLEQKTLANWVAMNTFNRLLVEEKFPDVGTNSDTEKMAGVEWKIQTEINETALKSVRRVTISVTNEQGKLHSKIDGFVGVQTTREMQALSL